VSFSEEEKCEGHLEGKTLVGSGRDSDMLPKLNAAFKDIFGEGGIVDQLGLSNPPHIATMMPGGELNQLAAIGHHPLPHWLDGAKVVQGLRGAGGVLEFVLPGCPECRSYYTDMSTFWDNVSILAHVAGHNHFSENSLWELLRESDAMAASLKLSKYIEQLYQNQDKDEVSLFVQWMSSLDYLQDLTHGSFQAPQDLKVRDPSLKNQHVLYKSLLDEQKSGKSPAVFTEEYAYKRSPEYPTPNVLQAMVAFNEGSNIPDWQLNVLKLYEEMRRVIGGIPVTKIMNEGFATFMQYLIPKHKKEWHGEAMIRFAQLLSGVARPSLSNPYFLGLECWKNLYEIERAKDENASLSEIDFDRKFVAMASHMMKSGMTDERFVKVALMAGEGSWIRKNNLFLQRGATWPEWDHSLPPPENPEHNEQQVVLSRDPKKIVNHIIRTIVDKRFRIPRIFLDDAFAFGEQVFSLRHEDVEGLPLEKASAAQTLYVLSQILKRPVSLKTKILTFKLEFVDDPYWVGRWDPSWGPMPQIQTRTALAVDARIEVKPDGRVEFFVLTRDTSNEGKKPSYEKDEILSEGLTQVVSAFKEDVLLTFNDDLADVYDEPFGRQIRDIIDENLSAATRVAFDAVRDASAGSESGAKKHKFTHAPTLSDALLDFKDVLAVRTARVIKRVLSGLNPVKIGQSSLKVQVLPTIPSFSFDEEARKYLEDQKDPDEMDSFLKTQRAQVLQNLIAHHDDLGLDVPRILRQMLVQLQASGGTGLGQGGRQPGDKYWGPGSGNGDGVGPEPGEDENPIGVVEIPLSKYGELLKEQLELPNMKKEGGKDKEYIRRLDRKIRRPTGILVPRPIIKAALQKGLGVLEAEKLEEEAVDASEEGSKEVSEEDEEIDVLDAFEKGFARLDPHRDIVVRASSSVPKPKTKARVVFVVDTSGSMWGNPHEQAKEIAFNVEALVEATYNDVAFNYVTFDTGGVELTRDEFYGGFKGGGTNYAAGLRYTQEVVEENCDEVTNCYVVVLGDSGSWIDDANEMVAIMEKMQSQVQHQVYFHVHEDWGWGGTSDFDQVVMASAQRNPWIDFSKVKGMGSNFVMDELKIIYRKGRTESDPR